jgi:hypothetical protein
VPHTSIDLRISNFLGHEQLIHAVSLDGHGWRLHAALDGGNFDKHCNDWQSVERTLNRLRTTGGLQAAKPPAARRVTFAAAVIAAILVAVAATQAFAQTPNPRTEAVQAFERATRDYARMHRRLEAQIGVIHLNITVAELNRIMQELAAAIRAERPDAKQGDFFTPALALELRASIDNALGDHGFTPGDVRENERREAIDASTVVLRVNGTFPWVLATAMFPCVIAALPPLPPELQYRIVGDTLALIDVHASLIVDLLPHALVETTIER